MLSGTMVAIARIRQSVRRSLSNINNNNKCNSRRSFYHTLLVNPPPHPSSLRSIHHHHILRHDCGGFSCAIVNSSMIVRRFSWTRDTRFDHHQKISPSVVDNYNEDQVLGSVEPDDDEDEDETLSQQYFVDDIPPNSAAMNNNSEDVPTGDIPPRMEVTNPLEESLVRHFTDARHTQQFYRDLMEHDLYLLQKKKANGQISFDWQEWERDDEPYYPIFTSTSALAQCLGFEEDHHIRLKGQAVFYKLHGKQNVIINPNLEFEKEIKLAEITRIRDGSFFEAFELLDDIQPDKTLMMGQPKIKPKELIDAFNVLFEYRKSVRKAYLCCMFDPSVESVPHLVIGVDVSTPLKFAKLKKPAARVKEMITSDRVDLIPMYKTDDEVVEYLKITPPFYIKGTDKAFRISDYRFGKSNLAKYPLD